MIFNETQELTIKDGLSASVDEWAKGLVLVIENNKEVLNRLGKDWIYEHEE